LRDVVDHAVDAERASYHDCRGALADVVASLEAVRAGPAAAIVEREARAFLAEPAADTASRIREHTRLAKALLVRSLRAAREDASDSAASTRRRLADLAGRELEREIAFGRATGIDPDGAKGPPLAEVLSARPARRSQP
ncbi:MAG: hypothetical protein ACREQ9_14720, partial [Candidatus Binatia bacterium]